MAHGRRIAHHISMPSALRSLVFVGALLSGTLQGQSTNASQADSIYQSAVIQLQQRKYQDAEDSFRKLVEAEPAASRGLLGLAEVWAAQQKADDALKLLQGEAVKFPARPELHYGIGSLALRTGKYDLAIAEFQLVLDRMDPNSKNAAEIYLRLGEAYRVKGDVDFALKVLQQAQTLQPENLAILNSLAFSLESSGQRQSAADQYRKILELDPKNGLALNNLAYILADTGADPTLALAYALRARQLYPGEPTIMDTLGWVYIKLNRPNDAIPLFRASLEKNPAHPAFHYHLAVALELKGDHAEAKRESEAALKGKPSKDDEQKINELLRRIPQ